MARATRSTAHNQEKEREKGKEKEKEKEKDEQHTDLPNTPSRSKLASKKRKRGSLPETDEKPPVKQSRTDATFKTEDGVDQDSLPARDSTLARLPNAGDVPVDPSDAAKILDVLEMYVSPSQVLQPLTICSRIDTQGLLDRVFPLPSDSPSARPASLSFRTLLKDPSQYPLSVLRVSPTSPFPNSAR